MLGLTWGALVKILLGLLRVIRAVVGFVGGMNFLTACFAFTNAVEKAIFGFIVAFVCLVVFALLRWLINKLHTIRYGVPHPTMVKEWNL